jgi:hypothetical protein
VGEFELFRIVDCARRSLERRGDSRPRRSTPPDLFRGHVVLLSDCRCAKGACWREGRPSPRHSFAKDAVHDHRQRVVWGASLRTVRLRPVTVRKTRGKSELLGGQCGHQRWPRHSNPGNRRLEGLPPALSTRAFRRRSDEIRHANWPCAVPLASRLKTRRTTRSTRTALG